MKTRARPVGCACGKRGWRTKFDADQIVINAKILRHLHHNNRRREQRSYRCTVNRTLWHVTSQELREPGPIYAPDDDEAAREYIEAQLLAELHRDTDSAWEKLLNTDYAAQTDRVLARIHQAGLRDGANRKAALEDTNRKAVAGVVAWTVQRVEAAEYESWKVFWNRFQGVLVARKAQARTAVKAVNIALSENDARIQNKRHREALRDLALAVHRHQTDTDSPTAPDRALWAALDHITVPHGDGDAPLAQLIKDEVWTPPEEAR